MISNTRNSSHRSAVAPKVDRADSEEKLLLQRLSEGDRAAFWLLWNQHQAYLYRRCLGWTGGNRTYAEEVLSQASLKAWAKLPESAAKIVNPKAWFIRLTYHLCIDLQRQRNRSAFGVENIEELTASATAATLSNFESPESSLLRQEMGEQIRHAIEQLPPNLRAPFVMRFCREMSYADIAQHLNVSNSNARKRIQQARSRLQKQLAPYIESARCPSQKSRHSKFTKGDRPPS